MFELNDTAYAIVRTVAVYNYCINKLATQGLEQIERAVFQAELDNCVKYLNGISES